MTEELAKSELGSLARPPAIDLINDRQLALLQQRAAKGCSHSEIAQFLELCVAYGLDPYAQEAWCARGKGRDGGEGQLLIMTGRDGLRKIANRNGLDVDCDVVREHDTYEVTRASDGQRVVYHTYSGTAIQRGPIVGAWAEVRKGGKSKGYYFAELSEFMPTSENKRRYSPWGHQTSVMILAAAERQAIRQATPLGGLLAEGEDARVGEAAGPPEALAERIAEWAPDADSAGQILAVIGKATELGHAGLADYATIEMTLRGRGADVVTHWAEEAFSELSRTEAAKAANGNGGDHVEEVDAEVVEDEIAISGAPAPPDTGGAWTDEGQMDFAVQEASPTTAAGLESQALELLDLADAADEEGRNDEGDRLRQKAATLRERAVELDS